MLLSISSAGLFLFACDVGDCESLFPSAVDGGGEVDGAGVEDETAEVDGIGVAAEEVPTAPAD